MGSHRSRYGDEQKFPLRDITDLPLDTVLSRLTNVSGGPETYHASCPAHADGKPSLSVTETEEYSVLIHCHRGCDINDILMAIELRLSDLFPSPFALTFGNKRVKRTSQQCKGHDLDDAVAIWLPSKKELAFFKDYHLQSRFRCQKSLQALADQLGVSVDALNALEVGYKDRDFIFPELNGRREIIGYMRRDNTGLKKYVAGGMRGLTIPTCFDEQIQSVFVAEGASDTAALIDAGATAIGRPAACASRAVRQFLVEVLKSMTPKDVVVVGDNDCGKNGERIGAKGAQELAQYLSTHLPCAVQWALPQKGYKDVREQIIVDDWSRGLRIKELEDE